ncbi:hypothetical protein E3Q10_01690 [Wallemia mellicola]|uniref:PITH domain-containing protein n=1 Tax=Wallemia mellicola TaxID=1708541 RepID=A0A4T0R2X9_9BASI|nr:hypothetical protein E3Q19_01753 [Wallemia mellicola]TIC29343.1 hypothetical protein E3Q11_01469 [Wallemia mellicola]TIC31270.1 hypothetical protein E3Q10_01690 [Wallemia mellicola]
MSSFVNLKDYVDPAGVSCLNVKDESSVKQLLGRTGSRIGLLESDADENLLLSVAFDQTVKVHSLKLGHSVLEYAPKEIKIFINTPELDFDKAEDDLETPKGDAMAVLSLTEKQAIGEDSIQLRFVRFQAVNSIQIYVKSNQSDGDILDAVSKAFGLVVRTINDEDFNQPSLPGSKAVTLKFAIPNMKMGFIIGRAGAKIKEIQEASGAKISTSDYVLPNSTERVLSIDGVADAVHIAIYHVGMILADQTAVPSKERGDRRRVQNQSYGDTSSYGSPAPYAAAPPVYGMLPTYANTVPGPAPAQLGGAPPFGGYPTLPVAETTSQKIYVPNNLVGGLIGKEPGEGEQTEGPSIERLVLISGPASGIQIAINMLSERIEIEKEKEKEKINPPL